MIGYALSSAISFVEVGDEGRFEDVAVAPAPDPYCAACTVYRYYCRRYGGSALYRARTRAYYLAVRARAAYCQGLQRAGQPVPCEGVFHGEGIQRPPLPEWWGPPMPNKRGRCQRPPPLAEIDEDEREAA